MTLAEFSRACESWERVQIRQAKEKAAYDYIQAVLIGKCIARYFTKDVTIPDISEVYGELFQDRALERAEEQEKAQSELSALRFKMFVKAHNDKFEKS